MQPRRPGGPRKDSRRKNPGGSPSPLALLHHYLSLPPGESGGFARPAPPEKPPLPLKFTCAECGETVHPRASRCSRCRAKLYPDDGRRK